MHLSECPEAVDDLERCEGDFVFHRPGPGGEFRARITVDVILDEETPVDCRITSCELVAWRSFNPSTAVRVPLRFDPAGPDPARPSLEVDPSSGLLDGQEVSMSSAGYGPPSSSGRVGVQQCRLTDGGYEDCDARVADATVDGGDLTGSIPVRARLLPAGADPVDCRTEACALVVSQGEPSEAAIAPVTFDPSGPIAPAPAVAAAPVDDLLDGGTVTVTGQHLIPEDEVYTNLCPADRSGVGDCATAIDGDGTVRADGTFSVGVTVRARFEDEHRTFVDCRRVACVLTVGYPHGQDGPEEIALDFDPGAPLSRRSLAPRPAQNLARVQDITVHGEGFIPFGSALGLVQCVGPVSAVRQTDRHCDLRRERIVDTDGTFTTAFRVRRHIETPLDGEVDCRFRHCRLAGYEYWQSPGYPSGRLLFRAGS